MRGRRSRGTAPPSSRLRGAWLRAVAVSGVVAGTLALGVPVANAAGEHAGGSHGHRLRGAACRLRGADHLPVRDPVLAAL